MYNIKKIIFERVKKVETNATWKKISCDENSVKLFQEKMKFPSPFSRILAATGITNLEDAKSFFKPSKEAFHNPFLMTDMQKSVIRINDAIDKNQKTLIYGDYDADGTTSISVFKKGLALLGLQVDFFAPNRFNDGYGLNPSKMAELSDTYDLIISCDTGIKGFEAANIITSSGKCDLIITDHHEPLVRNHDVADEDIQEIQGHNPIIEYYGDEKIYLPNAFAVIDPHRLGDEYPFKHLAGVGIAFKVIQALFLYRKESTKPLNELLSLVSVGTISDLAKLNSIKDGKLLYENRAMCQYGMNFLSKKPDLWMEVVSNVMEFDSEMEISSDTIGFTLGPMLNAPGRLEDPTVSVDLLISENYDEAHNHARMCHSFNVLRKEQTKASSKIIEELNNGPKERHDYGIVVQSDSYGIGIAGLVASRIQQHYYRPTIALAPTNYKGKLVLKGSARSIDGVHMLKCLQYCESKMGFFVYGGHAPAAGLTLEPERFPDLCHYFREAVMQYDSGLFIPKNQYIDEIDLDYVSDNFMNFLSKFEPFGMGNPKPIFKSNNLSLLAVRKLNETTAKITVASNNRIFEAITFLDGERIISHFPEGKTEYPKINLFYTPSYNYFRGNKTIQLMIQDMETIQ